MSSVRRHLVSKCHNQVEQNSFDMLYQYYIFKETRLRDVLNCTTQGYIIPVHHVHAWFGLDNRFCPLLLKDMIFFIFADLNIMFEIKFNEITTHEKKFQ